jgi:hypothetical protein
LPFFGFGHELSFFVVLSSSFLSFSDFHLALCVVNALIKGEIEDQERPSGLVRLVCDSIHRLCVTGN